MILNFETGLFSKKARPVSDDGIAMSCRVRLARNLAGERFPDWATERDREGVFKKVSEALNAEIPDFHVAAVSSFEEPEREVLFESHLISKDLLERAAGGGVAFAAD